MASKDENEITLDGLLAASREQRKKARAVPVQTVLDKVSATLSADAFSESISDLAQLNDMLPEDEALRNNIGNLVTLARVTVQAISQRASAASAAPPVAAPPAAGLN